MTSLDHQFESDLRGPSRVVWLSALALFLFLFWAAFAWVDEIVRGDGSVISSSRPQIIQNLEGGILAELSVKQGDVVEPGQILARLYGTEFQTTVDDLLDQIARLEVRRLRLEAELEGQFDFSVPAEFQARSPEIVSSERTLLAARQNDYVSRVEAAKRLRDDSKREVEVMEGLLKDKIVALIEVTRVRKAFGDSELRYNEIITQRELERAQAYSDTLKELATHKQALKLSQDQLDRTLIKSPMRGIVNNLAVTTIGGVIRPGEEIFQIIPLDEDVFIEANIQPKDIANVKTGQEATVKLSAYDYTIYGSLKGNVDFISADTFVNEQNPNDSPHYRATIRLDLSRLTKRQQNIELRPGMLAQVELHTGEKTILQYLLKPLYKSRDALREP